MKSRSESDRETRIKNVHQEKEPSQNISRIENIKGRRKTRNGNEKKGNLSSKSNR